MLTTYYFKGTAPLYLGELFTTSTELLTQLQACLTTAGWITTSADIPNRTLTMKGTTENNHNCWVKFTTATVNSTFEQLIVQGDLVGTGATLSPNNIITLNYKPTFNNYFYLTADSDSGCLFIYCADPAQSVSCHFGFLDRIDVTDPWAWYVGYITSKGYEFCYAAKSKHNNTNWRLLGLDYNEYNNYGHDSAANTRQCLPAQSVFDRYTVAHRPFVSYLWSDGNYPYNAGSYAHYGRPNYTNLPVLDSYFYIEGRGASTAYTSTSSLLYYRGNVKHAVTGLASYLAGTHFYTLDNQMYISGGSTTWQGFRIG